MLYPPRSAVNHRKSVPPNFGVRMRAVTGYAGVLFYPQCYCQSWWWFYLFCWGTKIGIPKRTGLELSLMSRFFIFQVITSFHRFSEALRHTDNISIHSWLWPSVQVSSPLFQACSIIQDKFLHCWRRTCLCLRLFSWRTCHSRLTHSALFWLSFTHSYILLQVLSGTAGGFSQLITLTLYCVMLFVLGSTPKVDL